MCIAKPKIPFQRVRAVYLRGLRGRERAQRRSDTGRAQFGHAPHQRQIALQHIACFAALLLARFGALVAHASDEGRV